VLMNKQELLAEIKECWALEREYGCEILTLPELTKELNEQTMSKKTRLTLDLSLPVRQELTELRDLTQADSLTEVVRRALAVYSFVVKAKVGGGKLLLRDDDGEHSIAII